MASTTAVAAQRPGGRTRAGDIGRRWRESVDENSTSATTPPSAHRPYQPIASPSGSSRRGSRFDPAVPGARAEPESAGMERGGQARLHGDAALNLALARRAS
jgi:hypothetical protein